MEKCNICARLPDFGPLKIDNWQVFLKESKVFFDENSVKPLSHKETLKDFIQVKLLGSGAFGKVILIKHRKRNKYYAMKALPKERIVTNHQIDQAKNEKIILQAINFPMTVNLKYFFQNNSFIYMVMPYIPGGELFDHIRKVNKLEEAQARFYISQVVLALEYLHFLNLVYRDLKPENILIDHTGYLKLTDFGFCKHLLGHRTYTVCGTPEYMAPEVILGKGYSKSVDWWATGVLMYELVAGHPPFYSSEAMKLFEKILSSKYKTPIFFSHELKDLLKNLLIEDLTKRFGNMKNGVQDIKDHRWFRTIDWLAILNRKVEAAYRPKYEKPGDTTNFGNIGWIPPRIAKEDKFREVFAGF